MAQQLPDRVAGQLTRRLSAARSPGAWTTGDIRPPTTPGGLAWTATTAPLAFADKSTPATPVTETPRRRAIFRPASSSMSRNRASSCSASAIASASPLSRSCASSRATRRDATDSTEIHFAARAPASAVAPGRPDPIASSSCTAGGMIMCRNNRCSSSRRPVRARAIRGPVSATIGVTKRQRPRRPVPRADNRPPKYRPHPEER